MADVKISALTSYINPDRVNDSLPIVDSANSVTKRISINNMLGLTSAPVSTGDTQTLTAKTLTAPTINGATLSGTLSGTYTIGGTPTFPASVVTLTGSQTLTNKVLTSPTINGPTITNASITADAITGFSSANTGTIYGVSITSGAINGSSLSQGTVAAAALSTSAITLSSTSSSTSQSSISTSAVIITGLTTTVTIPAGGRKIRIEGFMPAMQSSSISTWTLYIYNSVTVTGNAVQSGKYLQSTAGASINGYIFYEYTPSSGSQSYCLAVSVDTGTGQTFLSATAGSVALAFLTVKVV